MINQFHSRFSSAEEIQEALKKVDYDRAETSTQIRDFCMTSAIQGRQVTSDASCVSDHHLKIIFIYFFNLNFNSGALISLVVHQHRFTTPPMSPLPSIHFNMLQPTLDIPSRALILPTLRTYPYSPGCIETLSITLSRGRWWRRQEMGLGVLKKMFKRQKFISNINKWVSPFQ